MNKQDQKETDRPLFTPEQEARIRAIIEEELVKERARQLHEHRFGVTIDPNKQAKEKH